MLSARLVPAAIIGIILSISIFGLGSGTVRVRSIVPSPPHGDSVLFTYVFEIPGHYINDHALIRSGNQWHLFFIDGRTGGEWFADSNETIIGHATSSNLLDWTLRSPALTVGPSGALDGSHVYAPGVIKRNKTYYMFYTGSERRIIDGEHIFLATSKDLITWKRYSKKPIVEPDSSWAAWYPFGYEGGSGGPISGRDPFVLEDPKYGYVLYYVARLRANPARGWHDQEYSCVAAATSQDLIHWKDRGPILIRRMVAPRGYYWNHPESPCVVRRDSSYYLFWKGGSGTNYVVGSDPLHFHDSTETFLATSHASKVFEQEGKWYITSCSRDVNDFAHAHSDRTRGLFLARIVWQDDIPVIRPLADSTAIDAHPR